jgi:hypothetical protein
MLDDSEEQQPLENFFRAKGIKTKNEMADDVRETLLLLATKLMYSYTVWSNSGSSPAG